MTKRVSARGRAFDYVGQDGLETPEGRRINIQRNQAAADRHSAGYYNDVAASSWLRGGAPQPGFDFYSKTKRR
jgi:hypothetical protein